LLKESWCFNLGAKEYKKEKKKGYLHNFGGTRYSGWARGGKIQGLGGRA